MMVQDSVLNLFKLDGKSALVTGGGKGLGKGMALALAEAGADVALIGRNAETLESTAGEIRQLGRRVAIEECDVSDTAKVDRVLVNIIDNFGSLDILVNNAGIIRRQPAHEHSDEYWNEVIEVNLNALFRLCRNAGRHMIEQKQGKIINIASLLSFFGGITVPSYAASKGAVVQLTKALANEWAKHNVQINAIAPGYFETDNTKPLRENPERFKEVSSRIPAGRWGQPSDLKGATVFLASRASDYVNGHTLLVDGGWMAR